MRAPAHRSFEEWDKHPQAAALLWGALAIQLIKIGNGSSRGPHGSLEGIGVLDLCRVLLGPVCDRTLAVYVTDVLLITSTKLPELPMLDIDTSRGKRTMQLDLTKATPCDCLKELVKDADIFLQAYRPGGLQEKGFGLQEIAKFHSLMQTATGFNWAEAEALAKFNGQSVVDKPEPRALPMQALDHVVGGYFRAFGMQPVIAKTITECGFWEVCVSLAAVAQWLRSLGQLPPDTASGDGKHLPKRMILRDPEVAALSVTLHEATCDKRDVDGPLRTMTIIHHAVQLSTTPVKDVEASACLDRHQQCVAAACVRCEG